MTTGMITIGIMKIEVETSIVPIMIGTMNTGTTITLAIGITITVIGWPDTIIMSLFPLVVQQK
jgi:hypothetical protein